MDRVSFTKRLFRETLAGWGRHLDIQLAAALAFFSALALPPLLALTFAVVEVLFGSAAISEFVYTRVSETTGPEAAKILVSAIGAARVSGSTGLAAMVGVVGLLVAATGLVFQAQAALVHVFEWERGAGFKHTLVLRGLGLAAIAVAAALLVALFAAFALLDALDVLGPLSGWASGAAIAATAFAAVAMAYHWLSGRRLPWGASLAGATVTTVAVLIGRYVFQVYLRFARAGSVYGSAGSIFALLLWVYALAMMFLAGAEVARAWMAVTRSGD